MFLVPRREKTTARPHALALTFGYFGPKVWESHTKAPYNCLYVVV